MMMGTGSVNLLILKEIDRMHFQIINPRFATRRFVEKYVSYRAVNATITPLKIDTSILISILHNLL